MELDSTKTILVVDDEAAHLETLKRIFDREGYHALTTRSGSAALDLLRQHHVHVLLTDLVMPGMSGSELLKACRTVSPETEVVVMTAYGTVESAVEAMKDGAYDFVTKPLKKLLIVKVVQQAIEKQSLVIENRALRQELETLRPHDLIGQSPVFVHSLETIRQVGPSSATVLLTGESGTGKEVLARAIHRFSPRAGQPFVPINCAALPEGLLESELFGYERGAFTGADRRREGRFEAAHHGTLFLDELGEMTSATQVKLLRVLQDGEIERLGSNETIKVDLRLVAATNRDLAAAVKEGRFREDLFYRLNVIHVHVPALRERTGDVPMLANFFLRRYAAKNDKRMEGFTARAIDALARYPWPGNVRELENVIERAVVLSKDMIIDVDDLPEHLAERASYSAAGQLEGRGIYLPVGTTMEEAELTLLRETLVATRGDKNLAAKILGVATRTVYRKLSALDPHAEETDHKPDDEAD
jgi:Response regulator containing CheY-like receiver, AAA-type ATPase, and DNA-binding domains